MGISKAYGREDLPLLEEFMARINVPSDISLCLPKVLIDRNLIMNGPQICVAVSLSDQHLCSCRLHVIQKVLDFGHVFASSIVSLVFLGFALLRFQASVDSIRSIIVSPFAIISGTHKQFLPDDKANFFPRDKVNFTSYLRFLIEPVALYSRNIESFHFHLPEIYGVSQ